MPEQPQDFTVEMDGISFTMRTTPAIWDQIGVEVARALLVGQKARREAVEAAQRLKADNRMLRNRIARGPTPSMDRLLKHWAGKEIPDWVVWLAIQCDASTQAEVTAALGIADGLISQFIGGTYMGRWDRFEAVIRAKMADSAD